MRKVFLFSVILFAFISTEIIGQGWSALKRLTWNSGESSSPAIAVGSGNSLHVVWEDRTPGNYEIFYKNYK